MLGLFLKQIPIPSLLGTLKSNFTQLHLETNVSLSTTRSSNPPQAMSNPIRKKRKGALLKELSKEKPVVNTCSLLSALRDTKVPVLPLTQ